MFMQQQIKCGFDKKENEKTDASIYGTINVDKNNQNDINLSNININDNENKGENQSQIKKLQFYSQLDFDSIKSKLIQ